MVGYSSRGLADLVLAWQWATSRLTATLEPRGPAAAVVLDAGQVAAVGEGAKRLPVVAHLHTVLRHLRASCDARSMRLCAASSLTCADDPPGSRWG